MLTSQLPLLVLQASFCTSLALGILSYPSRVSQITPHAVPVLNLNDPPSDPFNATLGEPPDPVDIPWALNLYSTTFHSYSDPSLPVSSLRAFIEQAIASLGDLRRANGAKLIDPIPSVMFEYEAAVFSSLIIRFYLALDSPGATALTYYEVGGVIGSLASYIRKWNDRSPASAALELWIREGAISEQKAAGYIFGFSKPDDQ